MPLITPSERRAYIILGTLLFMAALLYLLQSQSPPTPFSAFMPLKLWVVDKDEMQTAQIWKFSILGCYFLIGLTATVLNSFKIFLILPIVMVLSMGIALLRFAAGMSAFH